MALPQGRRAVLMEQLKDLPNPHRWARKKPYLSSFIPQDKGRCGFYFAKKDGLPIFVL